MRGSNAGRLMRQGYAAIAEGNYEQALHLADELRSLRHSSAFEIGARALWEIGRREDAVIMLLEGTKTVPQVAVLWEYLGCYYSDLGQFEESESALRRGLECPGSPANAFRYNLAVMYERWGRPEDAWAAMEQIVPVESLGPPQAAIFELRSRILNAQGRYEQALAEADRGLAALTISSDVGQEGATPAEVCLRLHRDIAVALWHGRADRAGSMNSLRKAMEMDPFNTSTMALVRELQSLRSNRAKMMSVLICGRWPEKDRRGRAQGFFVRYRVLADNVEEALDFVRSLECRGVEGTLQVDEWEETEGDCSGLKGVYGLESKYHLFPEGQ